MPPTNLVSEGECREIGLDFWVDPEVAFTELLHGEKVAFWLDGGANASGGMTYMGAPSPHAPIALTTGSDGEVVLTSGSDPRQTRYPGSVFDLLAATSAPVRAAADESDGGFRLGWVGWLGYELGAMTVGSPRHRSSLPDAALMRADRVIVFDHAAKRLALRVLHGSPAEDGWLAETEAALALLCGQALSPLPEPGPPVPAELRHSRPEYLRMLASCTEAIAAGEAYQICLTNEITVNRALDAVPVYRRLRHLNPSHHGGFLRFDEFALLSSSPEQFLDIRPDGRVTTKPIKGTRRRGTTPDEDAALVRELSSDHKEVAENVMIVDLMRNDLSRVAEPETVAVSDLLTVETYQNVHQLVSTITARLAPGCSCVDVVEACLPAGSMTGAPKHSAMSIIDQLEGGARGPYAGAFGYLGLDGRVDLAMTIRSLVVEPHRTTMGAGGGITAWSVPEAEFDETLLKAQPLLAAANAVLTPEEPHLGP
ncbi:anthranilate synthase component I family protein [Okibacterium endophyticum]